LTGTAGSERRRLRGWGFAPAAVGRHAEPVREPNHLDPLYVRMRTQQKGIR